jgi:zinc and cadmium transporter
MPWCCMSDLSYVIIAASSAGLLSLLVATLLIQSTVWAQYLIRLGTPFAAGVLLTASFRDLLPHGVEDQGSSVLNGTLIAIVVFFLIEKGFRNFHHHHEEDINEDSNPAQGWLFLIGDVFHNALDGIALGSAFLINPGTGFIATIALVSHDIPLEVGEFGMQLRSGFTKKQTIIRNLLSSSTVLIGALVAFQFGSVIELPLGYLYGGIAGFFIYIALSDIVPTIHSSERRRYGLQTGFLILGLLFGLTIATFAHKYIEADSPQAHQDHKTNGHISKTDG